MTSTPKVSAVMPVYNGERFVSEAIESVLHQTFRDFELVIVDDGSTDRTPEILASYQKSDSRVVIHRQPRNTGFGPALNQACRMARGELVATMAADDVSLPERFDKQVRHMSAHPDVGALGAAIQIIDAQGRRGRVKRYPTQPGMVAWSMLFFNSLAHPVVTVRRDVLQRAGFYPSGCLGGTEDYAFFMRISETTRLANLPDVLLLYRIWGDNLSSRKWDEQERGASGILAESAARALKIDVSPEEALKLRGLSRDQYPETAQDIQLMGDLIVSLARAFSSAFSLYADDIPVVRRDAGIRLWLLAALASRRAPALSVRLAAEAIRISPLSVFHFAGKVARRLAGHRH